MIKKINTGEEYYLENECYPIRDSIHIQRIHNKYNPLCQGVNQASKLNIDIVENIIYDLLNSDMLIKDIAIKYNISVDQISRINNGKIWLQVDRPIPCRDIKKQNEQKALLVADLLLKTNLSQPEILKETGYKDRHTVQRINNHQIYTELLKNYPNPIRN